MPFAIVRNDITKMATDAIVCPASHDLQPGGGAEAAIHHAAGRGLKAECRRLGGCVQGRTVVTKGYDLACRYIIHTVAPVWQDGHHEEENILRICYKRCLYRAKELECRSIAFPLLAAGSCGFPVEKAMEIALDEIRQFLAAEEMHIFLVLFDKAACTAGTERFRDLQSYITEREVQTTSKRFARKTPLFSAGTRSQEICADYCAAASTEMSSEAPNVHAFQASSSLAEMVRRRDASFSQTLLQLIDEKGMTDVETYKKANIDRKLFSKIRSDVNYKPKKQTVLAFAIALELDIDETSMLLKRAGFVLSDSIKFDLIVRYFIERKRYDIFEINEALFAFDQMLIGC